MNMTKQNNLEILEQYFRDGCKLNCVQKLGLEIEHFIVREDTLDAVTYYEDHGIAFLLEELSSQYPREYREEGCLLGLYNNDYAISLEPAGQLEVSIVPKESLRTIQRIYESFLRQIRPLLARYHYRLVTLGYQPRSRAQDLPLIPKKRYAYMDTYFQTSGTCGRNMMRGTAATQVSIDYCCEDDFRRKYRGAYLLMPALKLLTDNTPVFEGSPYEGNLARTYIWERVDPARCGRIPGIFSPEFGFHAYAEYLWNLPLTFMPSPGGAVYTGSRTAAELYGGRTLAPEDIEHILSMTFLDVRLKHYVEIRGADSMPCEYVMAYLALIKGLFFDPDVLEQLLSRYPVSEEEIALAEASLERQGLDGLLYGQKAASFLEELLELAGGHLEDSERIYLLPFRRNLFRHTTLKKEYYGIYTQRISDNY